MALHNFIVAIGEECIGITIKHWLQEMKHAKPVIEENASALFETGCLRYELVETKEV
jgi:hypothetical protein